MYNVHTNSPYRSNDLFKQRRPQITRRGDILRIADFFAALAKKCEWLENQLAKYDFHLHFASVRVLNSSPGCHKTKDNVSLIQWQLDYISYTVYPVTLCHPTYHILLENYD